MKGTYVCLSADIFGPFNMLLCGCTCNHYCDIRLTLVNKISESLRIAHGCLMRESIFMRGDLSALKQNVPKNSSKI